MELSVTGRDVRPSALYKLVAAGYAIGAVAIFAPFTLLFLLAGAFGSPGSNSNAPPILIVVLIPVILTLQGLIFGGFVVLGLSIHRRLFRPIELRLLDEAPRAVSSNL
jgi:hypothetical protein